MPDIAAPVIEDRQLKRLIAEAHYALVNWVSSTDERYLDLLDRLMPYVDGGEAEDVDRELGEREVRIDHLAKEADRNLPRLDVMCEMTRLGVGKCAGLIDRADSFSLDSALAKVKYPWRLSVLASSQATFGYLAVLDCPVPNNRLGINRAFLSAVGNGHSEAGAVLNAVSKIRAQEAIIEAAPIDTEPY